MRRLWVSCKEICVVGPQICVNNSPISLDSVIKANKIINQIIKANNLFRLDLIHYVRLCV